MKVKSITINNYKSIGEKGNRLIFDDNVTIILGKNESGKSNLLKGLQYNLKNKEIFSYFNNEKKNRDAVAQNKDMSLEYELELSDTEKKKYGEYEIFTLQIKKEKVLYNKAFCEFLDSLFSNSIDLVKINYNKMDINAKTKITTDLQFDIKSIEEYKSKKIHDIFNIIRRTKSKFDVTKIYINKYPEIYEEFVKLDNIVDELEKTIPTFYYRNDEKILNSKYSIKEIEDEFKGTTKKTLLTDIFLILDIDKEKIIQVLKTPQSNINISYVDEIQERLDDRIVKKINDYYKQEFIKLKINCSSSFLSFSVKSDDGSLLGLDERSDGLRWYLFFYIDLICNDIPNTNVVYLFDEPASLLHVDAKKDILDLFDIIAKNNQIVYTTHSPFMIADDYIRKCRPVVKNDYGNTTIYNSVYHSDLTKYSHNDTLSPLLNSIGFNFKYSIAPKASNLNIVTEGPTDSMYLKAILKYFEFDSNINIIPAVGADNIKNVCSILFGWGCTYIVLYDYDKEGIDSARKLSNSGIINKDSIIFVSNKKFGNDMKIPDKSDWEVIESIFENDYELLNEINSGFDAKSKRIKAKLISEELENGNYTPSDISQRKMESIIKRLGIIN
jgi:predicted ATP-dependent endonuclease of OLD family